MGDIFDQAAQPSQTQSPPAQGDIFDQAAAAPPPDERSWWERTKAQASAAWEHPGEALLGAVKQIPALMYSALPQGSTSPVDPSVLPKGAEAEARKSLGQPPHAIYEDAADLLERALTPQNEAQRGGAEAANVGAFVANIPALVRSLGELGLNVRPIRMAAGKTAQVASDIIRPDLMGMISPRLANIQKTLGRLGYELTKEAPRPVFPGAPLPEHPGTFPGAPYPEHPGVFPGAPLPATPAPEQINPSLVSESRSLPGQISPERIYGPRPKPARPIPPRQGLQLTGEVETAPAPARVETPAKVTRAQVERQLEESLGGQKLVPGVPLKSQPAAQAAAAGRLPEGFTPVKSSAIRGYRYNPAAQEFESITTGGQHYIHGEVTPDQVEAFQAAESKGKAWNQIRSQSPLVAKVVNGKRVAATLPKAMRSVEIDPETGRPEFSDVLEKKRQNLQEFIKKSEPKTPKKAAKSAEVPDEEDLTTLLQKSVEQVRRKK